MTPGATANWPGAMANWSRIWRRASPFPVHRASPSSTRTSATWPLGRVIHGASGLSAPEYITRHILQPLGMTSTVWNQEEVAPERLALGYRWEENAWLPEPILPTGGDVGAFAGIFTTLRDLAKWVNLFLSAFPPRDDADNGIVQRSSLREMQQGCG
jgi:CubicO group peptidase (beta-lactamase class C family)